MKIGLLTGGGDCSGLNAIIRAVVRKSISLGYHVTGIRSGWQGLIDADAQPLTMNSVSGILSRGGTILKTSRTNPLKTPGGMSTVIKNLRKLRINALVAVGGDDTLGVALALYKKRVKVVGVPKTIDNDLSCTDFTTGFDTSINIVTDALDRLHSTAESHHRTMVVEVMGRHAGWIATMGGIAGGADCILVPEEPFSIKEVCRLLKKRHRRGRDFSIVVVAEGAKPAERERLIVQSKDRDPFGHVQLGGIGHILAEDIKKCTGFDTRVVVLGHVQRGGTPTAFDRVLGTRLGVKAVELIEERKFGQMVALQGNQIVSVSLEKAVGQLNKVDRELFEVARLFFG
ncbi:MAG: ATP-dependent 6-phosphofructokinase [archaeon]